MNSSNMQSNLMFADGTKYEPLKNPLMDKWFMLYPESKRPELSQVCDGYSCMWCSRCPNGENWKIPAEDMVEYVAYRRKCTNDLRLQESLHGELQLSIFGV